jgi:hypothetical protein
MNIPLSNTQIIKELGPPSEDVLLYKDLHKYDSIDELFLEDNLRIILIESSPSYGHWISLIKDGDTFIYFNSYGFPPDYEMRFLKPFYRTLLGDDPAEIKRLSRGRKLVWNKVKLQGKDSSTCGRWQVAWAEAYNMGYSLKQFLAFLKKNKTTTYDDLVIKLVEI